jgi:L-threonylcarbamoyladenylate synthase
MRTRIVQLDESALSQATEVVQAGGVIVFPTDTVYGLGCDAFDEGAVERIYELKGRPREQPLALHLGSATQISRYCRSLKAYQRRFIQRLLPGPYTLILPASQKAPRCSVNSTSGMGLRLPASRAFQLLASALTCPLAGTSVNRHGEPPLMRIEKIAEEFGNAVELILTTDEPMSGKNSTVIDLTGYPPLILRGHLPMALLKELRSDS